MRLVSLHSIVIWITLTVLLEACRPQDRATTVATGNPDTVPRIVSSSPPTRDTAAGPRATPSSATIDYSKLFAESNWSTSDAFLAWAKPLRITNKTIECSDATTQRIADAPDSVLFCEQVTAVEPEQETDSARIIWAVVRHPEPTRPGHDCDAGLIYLDSRTRITANSPADCGYVLDIEDPSAKPVMVFRILGTGEIGIVFDGHGAECAGRAVVQQKGRSFERVHELYWECSG